MTVYSTGKWGRADRCFGKQFCAPHIRSLQLDSRWDY
jgi:hypothetical protein